MAHVPLKLWDQPRWELRGATDAEHFFRYVGACFPAATTLFVEGTSFSRDIAEALQRLAEDGPYLPNCQTVLPRPRQYRLPFRAEVLAELERLAACHASPEIADHVFVYRHDAPLVEWPDAFMRGSPMHIEASVDPALLQSFAQQLGSTTEWLE